MSEREDNRIVDYLYDEMSPEEAAEFERSLDGQTSRELHDLGNVLETIRSVEDEDPPAHLDALILARAREVAEKDESEGLGWFRRLLRGPTLGIAAAASCAVVLAVITVPSMLQVEEPAPSSVTVDMESVDGPDQSPGFGVVAGRAPSPEAAAPLTEKETKDERRPRPRRRAGRVSRKVAATRDPAPTEAPSARKPKAPEPVLAQPAEDALDDALGGGRSVAGPDDGFASSLATGDTSAPPAQKTPSVSPAKARRSRPALSPEPPPAVAGVEETRELEGERPATKRAKRKKEAEAPSSSSRTGGRALAAEAIRASRALVARGDIASARQALRSAMRKLVRTEWVGHLSLELAELELGQRRHRAAAAHARDAMRSKHPQIRARALVILRAAAP